MDQQLSLILEEVRALRVNIEQRLTRLEQDQALVFNEIDKVKSQLSRLESTCARIELSCCKMSGHVDFVEDVYATVRSPFSRILGRFMGSKGRCRRERYLSIKGYTRPVHLPVCRSPDHARLSWTRSPSYVY